MAQFPSISLVIPVYNEEDVLEHLLSRVLAVVDNLGIAAEVIFVDDGSTDRTCPLLMERAAADRRLRVIALSRNFGHQIAVSAGLELARGSCVAILDGDLQDPPEVIPDLMAKLATGYDVVFAVRKKRKEHALKRASYFLFYRILRYLSDIPIPYDSGDFCIMTRRAADAIKALPERHRFVRGLRSWIGFPQTDFEYERDARQAGEPKYSFTKLLKLAFDGIFTMSEKPLRLATISGVVIALVSIAASIYQLVYKLVANYDLPGYASIAVGIFFLGGLQLITIGILGEYIGRIHNEVKNRPLYLIREDSARRPAAVEERPVNADDARWSTPA